jgi:3D (Asp-Asp-Asp) domain-containing protein
MKKIFTNICFLFLFAFCIQQVNTQFVKSFNTVAVTSDTIRGDTHTVLATMYSPEVSQCDKDPLITADGSKINPKRASEQKLVALSRDLLSKFGGTFKYGDYVEIKGAGHKDGIYRVSDTMAARIKNTIDILETDGTPIYKFENVTIRKIYLS